VLFFEDITQILKMQRMEAWREVAQRIAHEIKNPLTPIQLSAQRLQKRYAHVLRDDIFEECTRTIVKQVEDLKALVNEFSTFARLPAGSHRPEDLNGLVEEAVVLFREGHRKIRFEVRTDPKVPPLLLDREGIKRALINLLDNAVAACGNGHAQGGRIEIVTSYLASLGLVRLELADNGSGMTPEVKARLFEPYFSTKKEGTGLGLAIVSAIFSNHRAFIRVRDNEPKGSRFIVEFPVRGEVRHG
jgi:two-component system nitrogen regulation sensor histidine kinase NtrY